MKIDDRTGASQFLTEPDSTCPADFLALAGGGDPLPVGFVRAIGSPILETARDAVVAGLARPILFGEADQIRADAAALGWDLTGAEIVDTNGEANAIEAAVAGVQDGSVRGLIKGQLHTDAFMGAIVRRTFGHPHRQASCPCFCHAATGWRPAAADQ
jgi:phosphate acetyltransferase